MAKLRPHGLSALAGLAATPIPEEVFEILSQSEPPKGLVAEMEEARQRQEMGEADLAQPMELQPYQEAALEDLAGHTMRSVSTLGLALGAVAGLGGYMPSFHIPVSDWKHSDERLAKAEAKRARRAARNLKVMAK